ncbi:MAG TPA: DUF3488 and transglutaminase-like domain-containing protein [Acidimicrobiales bacterium]|nr:DUF3488 and transglutaminase-like domain-containing protein [Acidimicrobiales bacterium]
MTATLTQPAETGAPEPSPIGTEPGAPHVSGELLVLAEVALTAITVAAALGLSQLFVEGSFLVPVMGFGVGAHLLAVLCRRARLGPLATAVIASGGLALAVAWFLLPETTSYGLPTGETLATTREQLADALATFRDVVAPAPVEPGFVLASAMGAWVVAFTADTAAFRANAPVEAAVPGATLFIFGAALAEPQGRPTTTVPFLLALLAYWLAQRARNQATTPTWLASDARAGSKSLLRAGAALAVLSVAAATLVGPELPGAGDDAVIPWRASDRGDPESRVTISPLVDIRARIVDQADVEVFTVASERRSYWRLTSLETFDGRIWSSKGQYRPARGTLESDVPAHLAPAEVAVQDVRVGLLSSIWLPAAFEPVAVEGTDARYDGDSGSLLTEEDTASGLEYRVTSALKTLDAASLATAPNVAPSQVRDTYTALPDGFSIPVQQLAAQVAGDPTLTQFDRARRLQDHFRDGSFTYDLEIPPGHSGDALEHFLFQSRRGYCEQFAGAYAAMARAVGLPARVAVGFTPGELGEDGRYHVRGLHGHAWPEVYLDGYGWVAFEPTPGRGIPGGEPYTGVPEEQASPDDPTTGTTFPPTTEVPTDQGEGAPTTMPDLFPDQGGGGAGGEDPGDSAARRWLPRLLIVLALLVIVPLLWAGALALVAGRRRDRRRAAATTNSDRVQVAWTEVGELLARAGTPQRPWETPAEYARRAGRTEGVDPALLRGLAGASTAATYAAGDVGADTAGQAVDAAETIERTVTGTLDGPTRVRWALDPRPLIPARTSRRDVREELASR